MKLSNKILCAAGCAVAAATICSIVTVYKLASDNRVAELRDKMSSVIEQSESVAESMDAMHKSNAFDSDGLLARARKDSGSRPLTETYSTTALYGTIPIVASWQSVEKAAKKNGFQFLTPSAPGIRPRNPKNDTGVQYADAFKAFEAGQAEFFIRDSDANELVLARPVRLRASCLACHGDPATSLAGNGKDPLGFPMEGMKEGDVKGAFVLRAPLKSDPVIASTVWSMAGVGLVVVLIVLVAFTVFNKRLVIQPISRAVAQLNGAAEETRGAAGQINRASQALAQGSSQQAASLEQASTALEQISGMTSSNAENARQAKELAEATRDAAGAGEAKMAEMKQAMDEIQESSNNIARIVKSIDEIAFQTNILALNAAVEAARAGEAGAGFAVVADEVRSLAQRSALAAKETAEKIDDSIRKSNQGVEICGRVAESLAQIVASTQQVDLLVGQIAGASREQATGVQQVSGTMTQIDKLTQNNAAGAQEGASAAQELDAQTQAVRESVHALESLLGETAVAT